MFEAKYINVVWSDSETVRSIQEASDCIEIELYDINMYKLEAVTYSKVAPNISGQLAFHLLDTDVNVIPYFINSSNERIELISVKNDETGKVWWIENGKWNKKSKYRDSPLCRHAGEAEVVLGDVHCIIQIRSLSFTHDELNLYLQDFTNDLWDLILKEDSYVSAGAKKKEVKLAKQELIELIELFIKYVEKVLKNPKKELRETQIVQDSKKVRPIPRTFMEIATKGMSKHLTGRGYLESYNVAENRYIHAIVNKLYILINNMLVVTNRSIDKLDKDVQFIQKRLVSFSDTWTIDKEKFELKIQKLETLLNNHIQAIQISISNQDHQMNIGTLKPVTLFFKVKKIKDYYQNSIRFWGEIKKSEDNDWYEFSDKSSYIFELDRNIFENIIIESSIYKISGYIDKEVIPYSKKDGSFHKLILKYIQTIEPIKIINKLEKSKQEQNALEQTNWIRLLNGKEIEEQNNEKIALNKRSTSLVTVKEELYNLVSSLKPATLKLKRIKKQLTQSKIQVNNHFPGSMTFVQNPHYQGAHKTYKQIIKESGLDENLFNSLLETENIGIVDIPAIYERWCLLQIIKVLIDKYHFIPDNNWKELLIAQVLKHGRNITIEFSNVDLNIHILLTYEKELSNGKRPDYVLDFTSTNINKERSTYRLVLDAKFYENINEQGGISSVIDLLYNKKNYAEDGNNGVYILHPSKASTPLTTTPQTWSKNSYYGEDLVFSWDSVPPNHKYGAVLLSPIIHNGEYLDDLQRLMGMTLQYLSHSKIFCIVCGSSNCHMVVRKTKSGYEKYFYTCN
ncbi:MAG: hypothetical protein KAI79_09580, partial [Bacteroidales bacterium]|nr:hypothetical protein [Bacteroidales bacterium]